MHSAPMNTPSTTGSSAPPNCDGRPNRGCGLTRRGLLTGGGATGAAARARGGGGGGGGGWGFGGGVGGGREKTRGSPPPLGEIFFFPPGRPAPAVIRAHLARHHAG